MKFIAIFTLAITLAAPSFAQDAPKKNLLTPAAEAALEKAAKQIERWGKDPILVREVTAQNARKISAAETQDIDKSWMSGNEQQRAAELMSNACSTRLKMLTSSNAAFSESFVMDDQGANVCMTQRTSDYWQGDEAKWQKAFNTGRGAVFIDQPKYDTSAKAILVQVSVPVLNGEGAIGTITVGVNTSRLGDSSN